MRRGEASANARWDNTIAILTGDFLFAHASGLVAEPRQRGRADHRRDDGGARHRADARDRRPARRRRPGRRTTWPSSRRRPARSSPPPAATAACSPARRRARRGAAPLRRADRHRLPDLRRHHRHRLAGRRVRQDARHRPARGRARPCPMLYALSPSTPASPTRGCASCSPRPITDDDLVDEALTLLRKSPGLEQAGAHLTEYADRARAELAELPTCPAREALDMLARYVVARTR